MTFTNGWEKLICPYFYAVCVKVLGDYFSTLGFAPNKTKINGVLFRKGDLYLEVSYVPETAPKYSPSLIIGVGDDKYDNLGKPTGVPAWSILQDDSEVRKLAFWNFSNEAELEGVLDKLRDEVIEEYLRPLWEDRIALEKAVKNFLLAKF